MKRTTRRTITPGAGTIDEMEALSRRAALTSAIVRLVVATGLVLLLAVPTAHAEPRVEFGAASCSEVAQFRPVATDAFKEAAPVGFDKHFQLVETVPGQVGAIIFTIECPGMFVGDGPPRHYIAGGFAVDARVRGGPDGSFFLAFYTNRVDHWAALRTLGVELTLSDELVYDEVLDPLGGGTVFSSTPGFDLYATMTPSAEVLSDFSSHFWALGRRGPVRIVFDHCDGTLGAADTEVRPTDGSAEARVLRGDSSRLAGAALRFGFVGTVRLWDGKEETNRPPRPCV